MSTAKGYLQGYNAQAVANEDQVIVAAEVSDEQNDAHQLRPMIDATRGASPTRRRPFKQQAQVARDKYGAAFGGE